MALAEVLGVAQKKALEQLAKEGIKSVAKSPAWYSRMSMELTKIARSTEKFVPRLMDDEKSKILPREQQDLLLKTRELGYKEELEKEFPWANKIGSFENMSDVSNALLSSENEVSALQQERHPSRFPADVAGRLVEEGDRFTEATWQISSPEERLNMLNDAFKIIAEEACIPQEMIDSGFVYAKEYSNQDEGVTNAACNVFVGLKEDGNLFVKDPISISFNAEHLADPNYDFHTAIGSLYHEVIHAMQQQSVCETGNTFVYEEMRKEWKTDIVSRLSNQPVDFNKSFNKSDFIDYITGPMETYAHMQTDYFKKILQSTEYNSFLGNIGSKAVADIGIKSIRRLTTVAEDSPHNSLF